MEFNDVLMRYGISPLRYEDGKVLTEKEYAMLFRMWMNYRFCVADEKIFTPDKERMKRVMQSEKKMLFPLEETDKIDMMMKIPPLVI